MYTLEDINERAKLHFQMALVKWLVVFGILFPVLMTMIMYVVAVMLNKNPKIGDALNILFSLYLSPLFIGLIVVTTPLVAYASPAAIKKRMNEENAEEERQQREEHYRKMEELIEKMAKDKETT